MSVWRFEACGLGFVVHAFQELGAVSLCRFHHDGGQEWDGTSFFSFWAKGVLGSRIPLKTGLLFRNFVYAETSVSTILVMSALWYFILICTTEAPKRKLRLL